MHESFKGKTNQLRSGILKYPDLFSGNPEFSSRYGEWLFELTVFQYLPPFLDEDIRVIKLSMIIFFRCTVNSDIHTVHPPTDAHLFELW